MLGRPSTRQSISTRSDVGGHTPRGGLQLPKLAGDSTDSKGMEQLWMVKPIYEILIFYNISCFPLQWYQHYAKQSSSCWEMTNHITWSPGGVLSPKSYVDVPAGPRKSDYLYTNFLPNFPPISIPFSKEEHPIWIKLGAFYNNLPKIHPIYVIWAPSSLMKPPDRYTKFREKVPQKAGTYTYTMSMWDPPGHEGERWISLVWWNGSLWNSYRPIGHWQYTQHYEQTLNGEFAGQGIFSGFEKEKHGKHLRQADRGIGHLKQFSQFTKRAFAPMRLQLPVPRVSTLPLKTPYRLSHWTIGLYCDAIKILDTDISLQKSVKYLGVRMDQTLSMSDHISDVCRSSFLSLRRIGSIRPYLTEKATACLINSVVTSRLDFCNSTLTGITSDQINRLQRVQNCSARLIAKKRKHEHITPILTELHWLALEFRIQYKLAVLAFRHFEGTLPPYLSTVLHIYQPRVFFAHLLKNCSKFPGLTLSQPVNAHFILLPRLFGTRFQAVFVTPLISCNSRLIWKRICSVKLFLIHSSCVFFLVCLFVCLFVFCAPWVLRKILRLISTINYYYYYYYYYIFVVHAKISFDI